MRTQRRMVELTPAERARLLDMIAAGTAPARKLAHARILLKADQGAGRAGLGGRRAIAEAVEVQPADGRAGAPAVRRAGAGGGAGPARRRAGSTRASWTGRRRRGWSPSPAARRRPGRQRWTLRLLADKLVELEVVEAVSYETVRRALKKTSSSRG